MPIGVGTPDSKREAVGGNRTGETFTKEREKAIEEVKHGDDAVGAIIRENYLRRLAEAPWGLGPMEKTYAEAVSSAGFVNRRPEELNKLYIGIASLSERLTGEPYKPTIEVDADVPKEEREKMVAEKLLEDLKELPEMLADSYLNDYYTARAEINTLGREIKEIGVSENHSRSNIRKSSFDLSRKNARLRTIENGLARRLGIGDSEGFDNARMENSKVEPATSPDIVQVLDGIDLDNPKDDPRLQQRMNTQYLQIARALNFNLVDGKAFEQLESKDDYLTELILVQHARHNLTKELEAAIRTGDPSKICEVSNNILEMDLQRTAVLSQLKIDVAEARAKAEWANSEGLDVPISAIARKEGRVVKEKFKRNVLNPIATQDLKDRRRVGEFIGTVRGVFSGSGETRIPGAIGKTWQEFKRKGERVKVVGKKALIEAESAYQMVKHTISIERRRIVAEIAVELKFYKASAVASILRPEGLEAIQQKRADELKKIYDKYNAQQDDYTAERYNALIDMVAPPDTLDSADQTIEAGWINTKVRLDLKIHQQETLGVMQKENGGIGSFNQTELVRKLQNSSVEAKNAYANYRNDSGSKEKGEQAREAYDNYYHDIMEFNEQLSSIWSQLAAHANSEQAERFNVLSNNIAHGNLHIRSLDKPSLTVVKGAVESIAASSRARHKLVSEIIGQRGAKTSSKETAPASTEAKFSNLEGQIDRKILGINTMLEGQDAQARQAYLEELRKDMSLLDTWLNIQWDNLPRHPEHLASDMQNYNTETVNLINSFINIENHDVDLQLDAIKKYYDKLKEMSVVVNSARELSRSGADTTIKSIALDTQAKPTVESGAPEVNDGQQIDELIKKYFENEDQVIDISAKQDLLRLCGLLDDLWSNLDHAVINDSDSLANLRSQISSLSTAIRGGDEVGSTEIQAYRDILKEYHERIREIQELQNGTLIDIGQLMELAA